MHTANSPISSTCGTLPASSTPAGSYHARHPLFMRLPPHSAEAPGSYQSHQELQLQQNLWAEIGTRAGALAELVRVIDPSAEVSVDVALAQAELHAGLIMQALVALQTQRAERKQQVHTPRSHKPRSLSSPGPYVWSSYSASASNRASPINSPKLEEMELEAQSRSGAHPAQTWHSPRQRHGSLPTIEPKHHQILRATQGKSRQQSCLTPSSRTSPPGSSPSSGSPPFSPRHLMEASIEMRLSNPASLASFGDSVASAPPSLQPLPSTSSSGHASGSICFMPVQITMPESENEGLGRMKRTAACVQCGTTETPEWRSSEEGPRTLCNACGLRRARKKTKQRNEERKRTKEKGSIAAILNSN